MIAAIVPAWNDEDNIGACLRSLVAASRFPRLRGEPVVLVVALERCTDATEHIATYSGALTVKVDCLNVGLARAAGAHVALEAGARWLAFTDADSMVAPDWFAAQLSLGADAVCGTVAVVDWGSHGAHMQHHYNPNFADAAGRRHIHGSNMGVSAQAYQRAGGFPPLASSEGVALVEALERSGASIAWSSAPRVLTSARRDFRAPGGLGITVARIDAASPLSIGAT